MIPSGYGDLCTLVNKINNNRGYKVLVLLSTSVHKKVFNL